MKTKRLIFAVCIVMVIGIGLLLLLKEQPRPELVFIGYDNSDNGKVAKMELRNTTGKAIWLTYFDPILERPIQALPKPTYFYIILESEEQKKVHQATKVLPGDSVGVAVRTRFGEPAKQVGVYYYSGSFSSGEDFRSHWKPILATSTSADWKDRAFFYWQRLKRGQEPREIWCPTTLSATTSNLPHS